jgi:hypothetical protein
MIVPLTESVRARRWTHRQKCRIRFHTDRGLDSSEKVLSTRRFKIAIFPTPIEPIIMNMNPTVEDIFVEKASDGGLDRILHFVIILDE